LDGDAKVVAILDLGDHKGDPHLEQIGCGKDIALVNDFRGI